MKIVLVEDDPVIAGILYDRLHNKGHRVVHVETIYTFELFVQEYEPDVIVTDLLLSGISASELINFYIKLDCPICIISNIDEDDLKYFEKMVGARISLQKPFDPVRLMDEIEKIEFSILHK